MNGILVDSNVILDIFLDDSDWADWSESRLLEFSSMTKLWINSMIYAEVSIGFETIETLESALYQADFHLLDIPKEALFLAGKAFLAYRKNKGMKRSPLPDFYIGAQAAVLNMALLTRDPSRYRIYFPTVRLITPKKV